MDKLVSLRHGSNRRECDHMPSLKTSAVWFDEKPDHMDKLVSPQQGLNRWECDHMQSL